MSIYICVIYICTDTTLCTRHRIRIPLALIAIRPSPTLFPVVDNPSVIRFLSELFGVIYLFVTLLLIRIGCNDAVADDAVYEAEDPEGLAHEGMPLSFDHVDPIIFKCYDLCCLLNMHAVLLIV